MILNANDAFKLLKLEKKFPISKDTINKCFWHQAKENHPDITGSDEAMKKINEAHEWILNNIDKINSTNTKAKIDENLKFNQGLEKITDLFISKYLSCDDLNKKRTSIYDFIDEIEKYKRNNITQDMLREMFQRKMSGKEF